MTRRSRAAIAYADALKALHEAAILAERLHETDEYSDAKFALQLATETADHAFDRLIGEIKHELRYLARR